MRAPENTPTGALTIRIAVRVLLIIVWAVSSFAACAAHAACSEADGCPDPGAVVPASAEPAKSPQVQVAERRAPAQVASVVSDGRPAGALDSAAVRPVRAERRPAEQGSAPEPWLMLLAGLAFAGFVVAKRSRG
jgi:hypothetical protein